MSDLISLTIHELINGLRRGEFSSRNLTEAYLARIETLEPSLNAYITLTPELALKQADAADEKFVQFRRTSNQHGQNIPEMLGIPIAIKDVLATKHIRTTAGSKILENFVPPYHATAVRRLAEAGVVILGYDRRRPQREWVRIATVSENRMSFELERRRVGCGYDDLLIVGTDVVAAVDAMANRIKKNQWSISALLIHLFPSLAKLNPQETVHTKTLYSAINMLRRVPPGPLFAELIKHPAFRPVGDHYWQFDKSRSR